VIELFDAQRLLPRRDWSLPLATLALLLLALGLGAYGWTLQSRLQGAERERAALQQQLQRLRGQPLPSATLLADLQREAERLEAANRAVQGADGGADTSPSQWMTRLAALGNGDVSLSTIEFDRAGVVRIDGKANSPQAVSRFLQAWDRAQPEPSPVRARALEVRQDAATAPLLRFQLRATAPLVPGRS
jgi:Tfp pilus assembly protein PilN